jgi:hypothetical protein
MLLNCVMTLDAVGYRYVGGERYTCWGLDQLRAFNTQFHIREYSPAARVGFHVSAFYSSSVASNVLMNCIISAEGIDPGGTTGQGGGLLVGNLNRPDYLAHNAYCPGNFRDQPGGYSKDPWAVVLPTWIPGSYPELGSSLCSFGNQMIDQHRLEYDYDWRARPTVNTAMGPFEPLTRGQSISVNQYPIRQAGLRSGLFYLDLNGQPGSFYIIQSSSDLQNWADWALVEGSEASLRLVDYATSTQQRRFFRVVELPE